MSGGKTYQVAQVDPLNPHTKGMVYQVDIVGGGTQMEELPEATADNVGMVFQYLGETGSGLTHGFFYESQALGTTPETYGWVAVNVQQGGATNSATTDLSNLTATGANIANWSSNIVNCIVAAPQDIKLELSAGTLTVKAGTVYYVPNGAGVFTKRTLETDKTVTVGSANELYYILIDNAGNANRFHSSAVYSGATAPTVTGSAIWYDRTNNEVKYTGDSGSTWTGGFSLPIAVCTPQSGSWVSIDHIFNGFGYVGNAIFALPGTKVAYPNGRNANGTLKTGIISLTTVSTNNITYSLPGDSYILLTPYSINASPVIVQDDEPVIQAVYERWYSPKLNLAFYHTAGATSWTQSAMALFGTVAKTSSTYTKFEPGQAFRIIDYSDTRYIAHQAMPSGKYEALSVPTSGQTVTAPADGYLCFGLAVENIGDGISLLNAATNAGSESHPSVITNAKVNLAVSKGDVISVYYTGAGTKVFRFVYANGAK